MGVFCGYCLQLSGGCCFVLFLQTIPPTPPSYYSSFVTVTVDGFAVALPVTFPLTPTEVLPVSVVSASDSLLAQTSVVPGAILLALVFFLAVIAGLQLLVLLRARV